MRTGILAAIVAAALFAACLSEPNYQGGGRLDTLPGVGGDAATDGDATSAPPVDGFVAPPDNFVAPPADAGGVD